MDKKEINEKRLDRMIHASKCSICQEWQAAQFSEAPHWFGSMTGPRPRTEACLRDHRQHLEKQGMILTVAEGKALWETFDKMFPRWEATR
jgi:hypothetical protein